MKRLMVLSGLALALVGGAAPALAQALPPPLPELTPEQSSDVRQRLDPYRKQTESRVARGEITEDEADRLMRWREWQVASQVTGDAPSPPQGAMVYDAPPPDYREPRPNDYYAVEPAPYYVPYYRYAAPYYWGPRPYYYWGPAVCAGGFGRHFGGRICF